MLRYSLPDHSRALIIDLVSSTGWRQISQTDSSRVLAPLSSTREAWFCNERPRNTFVSALAARTAGTSVEVVAADPGQSRCPTPKNEGEHPQSSRTHKRRLPWAPGQDAWRVVAKPADHTTTADHGRDVNNPRATVLLKACGPHLGVTVSRALRNESDVPFRDQRADITMP